MKGKPKANYPFLFRCRPIINSMNIQEVLARKGAQKVAEIPDDVLALLNAGKIPTVNLTEWLAVDHSQMVKRVFPEMGIDATMVNEVVDEIGRQKKPSTMTVIKVVGSLLHAKYANTSQYATLFQQLSTHLSDSVRCYACYFVALNSAIPLVDKLSLLKPLVADHHFGVREVVWMALRPEMSDNLNICIPLMEQWAESDNPNIRRFSCEALRPRGVWCTHIEALKETPEIYLPVLEKLRADHSRYVQDSVGNWLNDASKSRPDFVAAVCERWEKESPIKETRYIIKKASRTIMGK